jgi:formylmethanofuran dehydrogenase subunit B
MINTTLWQNNISMNNANTLQAINATCPACGLLCDDIVLDNKNNQLSIINRGAKNCTKSVAFFEQKAAEATPQIAGKPATLAQAVAKTAEILNKTKQPLFTGLSTDVAGFRAVFSLAQKTNSHLTHVNAASSQRNLNVLQSTGWQTTTLTEVKNRADVIVCIGTDIVSHNPRFFERFIRQDGMFIGAKQREVIFIGENLSLKKIKIYALEAASLLACRADDLPEITLVLRALVAGKKLKVAEVAGVKVSDLQAVADKLKQAKYAVLTWVAKDLDFPHAELTIQNITEMIAILNQSAPNSGRAAGLALGGSDGDTTVNNTHTWLSGFALNDSQVEHDCVVWVNSFGVDKKAPKSDKTLIVFGNSNCQFETVPDVFIPIATPGLDCSGALFRVDSSVVLPLKQVRETGLPTLTEVVNEIEKLL